MEEDFISLLPDSIPTDDDGFVQSFEVNDAPGAQNFFDTYGFVVIRNVLTDKEIEMTLDEFFDLHSGLDKNNPETWVKYWKKQRFGHLGIIGECSDVDSVRQLENRQNPKVYEAFKIILQSDHLWVDHDRLGVMRPTKEIVFPGQPPIEMHEWRTVENWLHMDCNPCEGRASIASFDYDSSIIDFEKKLIIQGLITLTDARVEDGGFHCVPGAHKHTIHWAKTTTTKKYQCSIQIPDGNPIHQKIQKIPIRRGCLLLWTSLLPHGNHPNHSHRWRAVQYIRMIPTEGTPYSPLIKQEHLKVFPKNLKITPLGEKLFGMRSWEEEESGQWEWILKWFGIL